MANKKAGRPSGSAVKDPPQDIKDKVLKRDRNTCRFCGFTSEKYQEILNLTHNYADTRTQNLATACIFCAQCFHLEKVSVMRSGVLIWLPEITQASLNHIARAIYVARISQGAVADTARTVLEQLMGRREEAKKRLDTDDPFILSSVLRDYLTDEQYDLRKKRLAGVRLFPLDRRIIKEGDLEFNQFPQILAFWRSKNGPFADNPPNKWIETYYDLIAA